MGTIEHRVRDCICKALSLQWARNEFVHSWDRARFYANTDLFVYSVEMCHLVAKLLPNPLTLPSDRDKLVSGSRDDKVAKIGLRLNS